MLEERLAMKRAIFITALIMLAILLSTASFAQTTTASGALTLSATLKSSINVVFQQHAGGPALSGTTVSLGTLYKYPAVQSTIGGITIDNVVPAGIKASFPVDLVVTVANPGDFTTGTTVSASIGAGTGFGASDSIAVTFGGTTTTLTNSSQQVSTNSTKTSQTLSPTITVNIAPTTAATATWGNTITFSVAMN